MGNLPQEDVLYGFYLDGFSGQPSEPRPKTLEEKMAAALGAYDRVSEKPRIRNRDDVVKRIAEELAKTPDMPPTFSGLPKASSPRRGPT